MTAEELLREPLIFVAVVRAIMALWQRPRRGVLTISQINGSEIRVALYGAGTSVATGSSTVTDVRATW